MISFLITKWTQNSKTYTFYVEDGTFCTFKGRFGEHKDSSYKFSIIGENFHENFRPAFNFIAGSKKDP